MDKKIQLIRFHLVNFLVSPCDSNLISNQRPTQKCQFTIISILIKHDTLGNASIKETCQ